jgi:hypothetical protein
MKYLKIKSGMKAAGFTETSVTTCQTILCHNPEDYNIYLNCLDILKSQRTVSDNTR